MQHVVLDAYNPPNSVVSKSSSGAKRLFALSSHDKAGFQRITKSLVEHLDAQGAAATSPSYLANLAHTLAKARSGLSWKATCLAENASELREQFEAPLAETAARAPQTLPRVGFVFTGQGAQWAGMGMEMMHRHVFGESVARSAQYLKELGCQWDPVAELERPVKESRLGKPEISQPICSVIQVALVDELRSWNVMPTRVVGHSSGEIAAAYTLGALTHRDAIAAAYFRGTVASGDKLKEKEGGMMAVGCSREDAEALLMGHENQVRVACVNSPTSITLSGEVSVLEVLRAQLDERGIFARRLKVDVAYHSAHMHSVSMDYYTCIAELAQPDEDALDPAVTMVSSVTGSEIDPDDLGPYYWVNNLISPVLFADAVKEMALPTGRGGDKAVDLLVEVGPHSALSGPVEQTLGKHGIDNVSVMSMLVRNQSALTTSLDLAADLFKHGVPIEISKVNGDEQCKLLTNLPPYTWNHSETFNAQGRIQREENSQQYPTRSLLGKILPTMSENERVWRSIIHLSDEPWLRDHTIASTVLFPAAGMVCNVLEAVQQVMDPHKKARSFTFRDVSFVAAMVLRDDAPTEVTTHIRPGPGSAAWWEFTVSSCTGSAGKLRTNCHGLVGVTYEESMSPAMVREDAETQASSIADYHSVLSDCSHSIDKEAFYDHFERVGMVYGDTFRAVHRSHLGHGKTCFDAKMHDIGETFDKGKLDRPFLINSAVLDGAWQGWFGSTYGIGVSKDDFGTSEPMVPKHIGELEISADMPGDAGYTMPAVARSHRYGFSEFSTNITLFDSDLSRVLVSSADYRLGPLSTEPDAELDVTTIDRAEIMSEVNWNYSLDLVDGTEIGRALAGDNTAQKLQQVRTEASTTTVDYRLTTKKLLRLIIHQRPALKVVELVRRSEDLPSTIVDSLPRGLLLPNQVRYAVVDDDEAADIDRKHVGEAFALSGADSQTPPEVAAAELFVIPQSITSSLTESIDDVLERLLCNAPPGARIITALPTAVESVAKKSERQFDLVSAVSTEDGEIAMFNVGSNEELQSEDDRAADAKPQNTVILKSAASSGQVSLFARKLREILNEQGYRATIKSGLSEMGALEGAVCVSLLELEESILGDLSQPDFQNLRKVWTSCARLLWLTCGDDPAFDIVDGLARSVNAEIADARFQVMHLSSSGMDGGPTLVRRVFEASDKTADNEFREQDAMLQVPRAYRQPFENDHIRNGLQDSTQTRSLDDDSAIFRLAIGKPGLLDSLRYEREAIPASDNIGADELEISVRATGIDFRDIMACMGIVDVVTLGQEASGVVRRVGSHAAERFQPGDRVSTLTNSGAHATVVRCDSRATAKVPAKMSFEEAAAVPLVSTAAMHAIVNLAKLRSGQSILVHSAAGALGQMGIQLARRLGLVIYATVGSDEKRALLMDRFGIPGERIFYSRDASFAKGIKRATRGRGVDCVLNTLYGELLRVSWSCLAPFGTFVEFGSRDISDNVGLDMRPFGKSTTFTSIDVAAMLQEAPEELGKALNDVFTLLDDGVIQAPYPVTTFPAGQVQDAFRTMQQGKHRGKLVLSFSDENKQSAPVLCKAADSLKLDPAATYLFIGGLGGLGRSLAKDFVSSGARHLAFMSRSGDSRPEAKTTVKQLAAMGAQVSVLRGNVADSASFKAAMKQCSRDLPPIKGVIQMAMVVRDVPVENMSWEEWKQPLQPKVQGTWNLHQYFDEAQPLDFMIFCSSFTGIIGAPGQAQYGAGNAYQNALARYRRTQGLKAVSIDLGIMLEIGILAEMEHHTWKQWEDALGIREHAFLALMKSLINGEQGTRGDNGCAPHLTVGLGTADLITSQRLPSLPWFGQPRFASLAVANDSSANLDGEVAVGGASLSTKLSEAGANKDKVSAAGIITEALVTKLADILRTAPSEIHADRPLYSYGVDSLVALEVRNWITHELKASVSLLDILAAVPIQAFAKQLAEKSKLLGE